MDFISGYRLSLIIIINRIMIPASLVQILTLNYIVPDQNPIINCQSNVAKDSINYNISHGIILYLYSIEQNIYQKRHL